MTHLFTPVRWVLILCAFGFTVLSAATKSDASSVPLALEAAAGRAGEPFTLPDLPPLTATARNEASLVWILPENFAAGRYRLAFLATDFPQPTPGHSDENEPYRVVVLRGKQELAARFTYIAPASVREPIAREDFPPLFVRPVTLVERRSAGSFELRPGDRLRLDLRRHFLVAGDVRILPATADDDLELTVDAPGNPYHLFLPGTPAEFRVTLTPHGSERWDGVLELDWGDALTGETRQERRLVSAPAGAPWTTEVRPDGPLPNGAWFLRASLFTGDGVLVASLQRHFVYGPRVNSRALPPPPQETLGHALTKSQQSAFERLSAMAEIFFQPPISTTLTPRLTPLLVGPTGVGKTAVAKQIAATIGSHLIRVSLSTWTPVGSRALPTLRRIGQTLSKHDRVILVIDEIDKLATDNGAWTRSCAAEHPSRSQR